MLYDIQLPAFQSVQIEMDSTSTLLSRLLHFSCRIVEPPICKTPHVDFHSRGGEMKAWMGGWWLGAGADGQYNLSPAAMEVGFSQQAAGMIPGTAQCAERDHRDDIPTL